ncbi:MAG: capsular biosynthesis protein [Bacteroidetes bacterium]|nr:capsular biosynthesis protein [Bacteroidota bacterium]
MKNFLSALFHRPQLPPADFSVLNADMHSHLIPGIDDGAQTLEDSLHLIRGLNELGYKKFITTPHVISDHYRNTPEIILLGLKTVQDAVKRENIPVEIHAAAEYYLDADFEKKIVAGELLTFGNHYVLVEISFLNAPENFDRVLSLLFKYGHRMALAHAERYPFWYNLEKYKELKHKGVLLQVNINSLGGYYSGISKKIAETLIDNEMVDLLGTDCHKTEDIEKLKKCATLPYLHRVINSGRLLNGKL